MTKQSYKLNNIFPTVVYEKKLDRDFHKKEMDFVLENGLTTKDNVYNAVSQDMFVLEKKQMKSIKEFCLLSVKEYFHDVMKISDSCELYITQSWLNYTKQNQAHHQHTHSNSILSGVFYFQTDSEDKITFVDKSKNEVFGFEFTEFNLWNSKSWWFPSNTGTLYIFPSDLSHEVQTKKTENTRISLSFNTFFKGQIGFKDRLNLLTI
jgi:uncharacterized protein (TIGR02466 family)